MAKIIKPPNFKDTKQLPSEPIIMEIGRIAIVAASIEDLLHSLYWKFSGLTDSVGAIITGDARAKRLSEDVIRIVKAAKVDEAIVDDLKDIFSDLTRLTSERNELIHWIWSWNTTTGEDRIDPPGYKPSRQGRYVQPEDAVRVGDDLVWIEHRLGADLMTEKELRELIAKYGLAGAPDAPTPWLEKLARPTGRP